MSQAKSIILERVRAGLRDVPPEEKPADVPVARDYRLADSAPRHEILDKFVERVADYRAVIHRVAAGELAAAIQTACERRGVRRLLVPTDIPEDWIPKGVEAVRDHALSYAELDATDGVLTASALGISQTGTIVLDGGPAQGRRAISLIPDYHLCVIREDQVVGLIPEAISQLASVAKAPGRPITWISGPSATSDIELNRVEGVHGPRTLEVLLVAS